jgi:hypothetical protein
MADPFFDNVSLLLEFEDGDESRTAADSSNYDYSLTMNGTGNEVTTDFSKFGDGSYKSNPITALYVNNKGTTTDFDAFDMGSGDFTVDGWFRNTSRSTFYDWLFGWGDINPVPDQVQWGLLYHSGGFGENRIGAMINTTPSDTVVWADLDTECGAPGADFFTDGMFYHIHMSRDGNDIVLGVNGVNKTFSGVLSGALYDPRDGGYAVGPHLTGIGAGKSGDATGTYFGGWVDMFRITKGVSRFAGATYTVPDGIEDYLPATDEGMVNIIRRRRYRGKAMRESRRRGR